MTNHNHSHNNGHVQQLPDAVPNLDGPTLRAVRENVGVPLRRIARNAGMSHGHLSKVERGEHGRPVTPAIMAAYEKVTGVKLVEAVAQVAERRDRDTGRRSQGKDWRPGEMTDMRRKSFNAAIGAIAIGGHLGEPISRLIDSTGRPVTPDPVDELDIVQLEHTGGLLTAMDMRYGGGLVAQLAKTVLRWATAALTAYYISEPDSRRLHTAIGTLAHRAGWSAFDIGAHEPARALFRLALHLAAVGEDHNLRGHVLADVAAQHNQLGYHHDALDIVRLAEGDERITPAVRMILHGVKARTHGRLADTNACRRQIEAAEAAFEQASAQEPGWVGRLADPAKLYAITGHALADLAEHTGTDSDREHAEQRLTKAIDQFHPDTHARARALCVARVGLLHVTNSDPDQTEHWTQWIRDKLPPGPRIRSNRLDAAVVATPEAGTAGQPHRRNQPADRRGRAGHRYLVAPVPSSGSCGSATVAGIAEYRR